MMHDVNEKASSVTWMQASRRWLSGVRRASVLAAAVGISACGTSSDPGSDSTTHFWRTCGRNSECGADQLCICGYCTHECEAARECEALASQCVALEQVLSCEREEKACVPNSVIAERASTSDAFVGSSDAGSSQLDSSGSPPDASLISTNDDQTSYAFGETSAPVTTSFVTSAASSMPVVDGTSVAAASDGGVETVVGTPTLETPMPNFIAEPGANSWQAWSLEQPKAATDCAPALTESDAESCDFSWQCAEREYAVHCSTRESEAGSECACYQPGSSGTINYFFAVPTRNTATACRAAFDACTTPHAEQSCSLRILPPDEVEYGYSCEWQTGCTSSAEAFELQVAAMVARSGICVEKDGYSFCTCSTTNLQRSYVVPGVTGDAACQQAAAACETDDIPTEWFHHPCETTAEPVVGEQACELHRNCPLSTEVSADVFGVANIHTATECHPTESGDLDCVCSKDLAELQWTQPAAEARTACDDGIDLCERVDEIAFAEPSCGEITRSTSVDSCWTSETCTSVGTLDERQWLFDAYVGVNCMRGVGNAPWSCLCVAGSAVSTTELASAFSGSEVCEQHLAACRPQLTFAPQQSLVLP